MSVDQLGMFILEPMYWAGINLMRYAYYLIGLSVLSGGALLWRTRGRSLAGFILVACALLSSCFVAYDILVPRILVHNFVFVVYLALYGAAVGWFCYRTKQTGKWHVVQAILGAYFALVCLTALAILEQCKRGNCL